MERAVTIVGADEKQSEIIVKATANSLFLYKANFNRDGLTDIFSLSGLSRLTPETADIFLSFLWAFAKSKDSELLPYKTWVDGFGLPREELAIQLIPQISDIIHTFMEASIEAKKLPATRKSKGGAITTETILRRSIERGLSASDFETMTFGMVIDFLIDCQNEDIEAQNKKKRNTREATEADVMAW